MIKNRFKEILEFTKSESPYSKANKGWINEDIFLEFGKSLSLLSKQKETARITLLWAPLQRLIYNLILIIIISSLIVLTTLKASAVRFNFISFIEAFNNKSLQLEKKESNLIIQESQISDININSEIEDDSLTEEIIISKNELSNKEDLLKSEDNISKNQISEVVEGELEESEIKNDLSIKMTKKSKSNFF